jgi:hypothetical protein
MISWNTWCDIHDDWISEESWDTFHEADEALKNSPCAQYLVPEVEPVELYSGGSRRYI